MNSHLDYSKYLSQQPLEVLEKIFSFMSLDQLKKLGQDRSIREKMNFDSLGFSEIFLHITGNEEKRIIQKFHPAILQSFGIEVIKDRDKSFFLYTVSKVNNWAKKIGKIYDEKDWSRLDFERLEALILYSDLDTVQNIVGSDRFNLISRIEIEKLFYSLKNFDLQIIDLSKRFQILVGSDRFRTIPLNEFIHFICLSCRLFKNTELLLIFLAQDFTFDKLSESENQHIYQLIQSFILSKRHDCIQILNDFGLIQTFLQYGGDFYDLFMQSIEARNQKIPNLLFSYFINELNIKNIPDGHNFLADPAVVVDIIIALIRNTHQECEFFYNEDILRVLNVLDVQNILKNAESSFRFDVSSKLLANLPIDLMIDLAFQVPELKQNLVSFFFKFKEEEVFDLILNVCRLNNVNKLKIILEIYPHTLNSNRYQFELFHEICKYDHNRELFFAVLSNLGLKLSEELIEVILDHAVKYQNLPILEILNKNLLLKGPLHSRVLFISLLSSSLELPNEEIPKLLFSLPRLKELKSKDLSYISSIFYKYEIHDPIILFGREEMVLVFSQEDLENFVYNASQKMYKLDFFCNILTATVLQKLSDSFLNELFEYMVINENASVVRTILESERSSKISCLNEKKIVQKFYTSEGLNKILDLFKIRLKKRTRAI